MVAFKAARGRGSFRIQLRGVPSGTVYQVQLWTRSGVRMCGKNVAAVTIIRHSRQTSQAARGYQLGHEVSQLTALRYTHSSIILKQARQATKHARQLKER